LFGHTEIPEPENDQARKRVSATPDEDVFPISIAEMRGDSTAMRPTNKEVPRLHVIKRDGSIETLQNIHLDVKSAFYGNGFMIPFTGAKHWELRVKGYGEMLWRAYDYCTLKRWPYIREVTRDFANDAMKAAEKGVVFTEVEIVDVTPKALKD